MNHKFFLFFLFIILNISLGCKGQINEVKIAEKKLNLTNQKYYFFICINESITKVDENFITKYSNFFLTYPLNADTNIVFKYLDEVKYEYNIKILDRIYNVEVVLFNNSNQFKLYSFRFKNIICYEDAFLDAVYITSLKKGIIGYYFSDNKNDQEIITSPKGKIPTYILDLSDKYIIKLL